LDEISTFKGGRGVWGRNVSFISSQEWGFSGQLSRVDDGVGFDLGDKPGYSVTNWFSDPELPGGTNRKRVLFFPTKSSEGSGG